MGSIKQTIHRILFKFNKNIIGKEFFTYLIDDLGIKHATVVGYKINLVGELYHVQLDLIYRCLPVGDYAEVLDDRGVVMFTTWCKVT